ncbi:hypothetical protein F5Y16DRAFT_398387 [Xylariaceae sp. FL0255]|nr:hypothetical protein F5Y16DRAFT_398387 [Xylariaceae sp. FL0255]
MSDLDWSHLSPSQLQETLNSPSIPPPVGVTPNFVNPANENTVALIALIITLTLSSAFLLLRIYVVFFKVRQPHFADYLMPVGYVFYLIVLSGSLKRLVEVGLFVHQWNVLGKDIAAYLQLILIGDEFWLLGICIVKSSILIEWHRLFAPTRAPTLFRISCLGLLAINLLSYIAIFITLNLNCRPFAKIWDKSLKGTCIDLRTIHLAAAIVDLVLDLAILILPQRIIWKLQMSRPKRLGISTVFTIGILATIASLFLIIAIVQWRSSSDMTYHYSGVALWAIAEMTCGILVFCAPVVPKFCQGLHVRWISGLMSSGSSLAQKVSWPSSSLDRHPRSKSRDYREIDESKSIRLHAYGSPRPTDRQYGIFVTTDIIVDTVQKPDVEVRIASDEHLHQYPWAAESTGVPDVRAEV